MKKVLTSALVLGLSLSIAGAYAATQKRVSGIITSTDGLTVTIAPVHGNRTITGKVDAVKTHVLIDGKAAKIRDLHVTDAAKAELSLDDVWISINVDSAH